VAVLLLPQGARTDRVSVVRRISAHWLTQTVARYVHHASTGS
jgi:hypothetical protein